MLKNIKIPICSRMQSLQLLRQIPSRLSSKTFTATAIKCESVKTCLVSMKDGPPPALVLGVAGLIPFASAPAYMIQMNEFMPLIAEGQMAYGAVILSFLGGVRWGKLVTPSSTIEPSWTQFASSVSPSLIAWPALLMNSYPLATVTVTAGLGLCGYIDFKQYGYQPWFKGLRIVLTTVASVSLLLSLALSFILDEKPKKMLE